MVSIQIQGISTMVYPMVGRGVHDRFKPFGHFVDGLRMDPKLVQQTNGHLQKDHSGVKPNQGHP